MTILDFVKTLKIQTSDAAVVGTIANLERAPGKKPMKRDITLADWYRGLSEENRLNVRAAMQESAELAIFNILTLLDGVAPVEDGADEAKLQLFYLKNGNEILLNDRSQKLLHDRFSQVCLESEIIFPTERSKLAYEVGLANELRGSQSVGDGLDLHEVSPQSETQSTTRPAILLPKNEHRKI